MSQARPSHYKLKYVRVLRRIDSSEHPCAGPERGGPVVRHRREATYETVLERERRHLLAPLARLILGRRRERTEGIQRLGRGPHRF